MEFVFDGSYKKAIDKLDSYIRRFPDDDASYFFRGQAKYSTGQYDEALDDFSNALILYPGGDEHYRTTAWRGLTYRAIGQYQEALQDFNDALSNYRQDDARTFAYLGRGLTRQSLKEYEGAIQDFEEVIRLNADFADWGYMGRGNARYCLGRLTEAIADYGAALLLDPNNAYLHYKRSAAWYGLDDIPMR